MRLILEGQPDELVQMLGRLGSQQIAPGPHSKSQADTAEIAVRTADIAEPAKRERRRRSSGNLRGRPIGERPSLRTLKAALMRAGARGVSDEALIPLLKQFGVERIRDITPAQR